MVKVQVIVLTRHVHKPAYLNELVLALERFFTFVVREAGEVKSAERAMGT
jgi:hypothetical protein